MFKKTIVASVKLALIATLFLFLATRAARGAAFSELKIDERGAAFIFAGLLFNLIATTITILRWRVLVQALDVSFSLVDSLRYGFLGFAFNLSPLGVVGGDASKIVLVARKTSISAEAATASVVIDRFIGLYAMFILGLCFAFASGFYANPEPLARFATRGLIALTIAATAFLIFIIFPQSPRRRREKIAGFIPIIGDLLQKTATATLLYRRRKFILLQAFAATLIVHSLFAVSLYCFAQGLYSDVPSLVNHVVLYCSANVGSIIPLSAGPFEYFLDELYPLFNNDATLSFTTGYGATIGVVYRLSVVAVAALGVVYYYATRTKSNAKLS